jgi:hypothetical protein
MADKQPDSTSADYDAMSPYWDKVAAILGGTDAMRAAGEKYLPRFPQECEPDYEFRRKNAKFTNVFRDIVENLASRPFSQELGLRDENVPPQIAAFTEDVDRRGNHLHVFAQAWFFGGVANTIEWVMVDYTKDVPPGATLAQEKALGAGPYWVRIEARDVLAVYSDMVDGVETFVHVRLREDVSIRDGFGEKVLKRVRIMNRAPIMDEADKVTGYGPATWTLVERRDDGNPQGQPKWKEIASGAFTIGIIPMVPFVTGRRLGNSWRFAPSMQDAADLQIELFQQESGLKTAKEATAFPMLAGIGVSPQTDAKGGPLPISVGPKSVLYAPPSNGAAAGDWKFIEPGAQSLRFLADDVKETISQLRELGRQPLTAQTGNLTVVSAAFAAQKGNAAIQAWALNMKDALETALKITCQWMRIDYEPEVVINTDFDLGLNDDKGPDTLLAMRAASDLSQRTLWHEMRRRNILSPEFDADTEDQNILDELPGDAGEEDLNAATLPPGKPALAPQPEPPVPADA